MYKDKSFSNLLVELFIIIGGFILAETIINQFLSLSSGVLPWWILPSFSILLIITALNIKQGMSLIEGGILSVIFLGGSIILIVLKKNTLISPISFLWYIFILSVITLIIQIIFFIYKIKRKKGL